MKKFHHVALIFAGGVGKRMQNGALPKQFLEVDHKPIIVHTLEIFEKSKDVDGIIIAITPGWAEYLAKLVTKFSIQKVFKIVEGGSTSQLSQFNALKAMQDYVDDDSIVLIHDGVRPLIDNKIISENIASVAAHGSAITIKKAIETVVTVGNSEDHISEVLNRDHYRMAVAPQSYYFKDIFSGHLEAQKEGEVNFIDSAQLMQHFGKELFYVEGTTDNIKITTPVDYYIFKGILEARRINQIF